MRFLLIGGSPGTGWSEAGASRPALAWRGLCAWRAARWGEIRAGEGEVAVSPDETRYRLRFRNRVTERPGPGEPPIRPVGFWDDCVVRHSFPDYQSLLTFFALRGPARIGPRRVRGPTQLL